MNNVFTNEKYKTYKKTPKNFIYNTLYVERFKYLSQYCFTIFTQIVKMKEINNLSSHNSLVKNNIYILSNIMKFPSYIGTIVEKMKTNKNNFWPGRNSNPNQGENRLLAKKI